MSLYLSKLESNLDKALSQETRESLTEWLGFKRNKPKTTRKMNTEKEKAIELIDKYRTYLRMGDKYGYLDSEDEIDLAKQCALIVVDEILDNFGLVCNGQTYYTEHRAFDHYSKVKQEIINYKTQEQ
jgi:hypothetical protein